ncbi:MAG TPA: hypothetical protein VIO38_06060 [Rariglobus sp.]
MKTRLFALLFLAIHPLLAQRAQLTRLTDLSQLGIHTLQFTADVPPGKVFVIEMNPPPGKPPRYHRKVLRTDASGRQSSCAASSEVSVSSRIKSWPL